MESDDGQEKYLKQYIQRQELLLLDSIRKSLDLEIKVISLNSSLTEYKGKYEESQKQVEVQNDLMQQAANGVESLTVENKKLEKTLEELKQSFIKCRDESNDYKTKNLSLQEELKLANHNVEEIRDEYNRQIKELNELFQENQDLKSKLPINKTKAKKQTVILPPDEF